MLEEINFSLVNACNASCAFCPRSEYKAKVKIFPKELMEKIVDEMKSPSFKKKYQIKHTHIGENGESTMHPQFIEMLRLVNSVGHPVDLYTNFSTFTPDKSKTCIDENLLVSINTNIDGSINASYKQMKGLDYLQVANNVKAFIEQRGEKSISLFIHVVLAENYVKAVEKHFGKLPYKLEDGYLTIPNEFEKIEAYWREIVKPSDGIGADNCLMWAERNHTEKLSGKFNCFNIGRIQRAAFINPNGDWYICCFDIGNELILGNLYEQSLAEIYESKRRKGIIKLISEGKYDEIGSPCNRVDCCQVVDWRE